ncbi:putative methyltransferase METT10D (Methyltransferase 10domain-containing protein), partial [Trichinella spiralis]
MLRCDFLWALPYAASRVPFSSHLFVYEHLTAYNYKQSYYCQRPPNCFIT